MSFFIHTPTLLPHPILGDYDFYYFESLLTNKYRFFWSIDLWGKIYKYSLCYYLDKSLASHCGLALLIGVMIFTTLIWHFLGMLWNEFSLYGLMFLRRTFFEDFLYIFSCNLRLLPRIMMLTSLNMHFLTMLLTNRFLRRF